mgnify:CR=1 FL=1
MYKDNKKLNTKNFILLVLIISIFIFFLSFISAQSYSRSFVDYALGMAYQKDGKNVEAQTKFNDAMIQKNMFTLEISPRDKSSQTMVQLDEPISGDDFPAW